MSGAGGETVWTGDPAAVAGALRSLRERYRVVTRRPVEIGRTWLDTGDWRLHRAGLALCALDGTGDGSPVLELTAPEGTVAVPDETDADRPRLLGDLPEALHPALGPVLDVRAVFPVVTAQVKVAAVALLDDEGKTVVRLEHERPDRVRLLPVRGYRKDAARAGRALADAGLAPDERPAYQAALAAAEVDPDAVRRLPVGPDLPATVAVARVLLGFLDDLEDALQGTVDDVDTEFLHDLRVGVRRSRSAVKLLADALPPRLVAWAAPQLKWLGDLTTPLRDLDVHLLDLPGYAARLHGGRPDDLLPLADHLHRLRARERRALVRGLRSARFERFRSRWRAELEELAQPDAGPLAGGPDADGSQALGPDAAGPGADVGADVAEAPAASPDATGPGAGTATADGATALELGLDQLARARRRVVRPGRRITPDSPAEALHDLRKRAKELRYLLEIFGPLTEGGAARRGVKELKGLQDVLGRFQDSEVQRDAVVAMAEAMLAAGTAPATTLLAMGEIAARLHDDQVAARAEFSRRFERFAATGDPR